MIVSILEVGRNTGWIAAGSRWHGARNQLDDHPHCVAAGSAVESGTVHRGGQATLQRQKFCLIVWPRASWTRTATSRREHQAKDLLDTDFRAAGEYCACSSNSSSGCGARAKLGCPRVRHCASLTDTDEPICAASACARRLPANRKEVTLVARDSDHYNSETGLCPGGRDCRAQAVPASGNETGLSLELPICEVCAAAISAK